MSGPWWRLAEVTMIGAVVAPMVLVTAFALGWWFRGLVFGWETADYWGKEGKMLDVERIRRAALRRIALNRVGMVIQCDQILLLIERGDARIDAYEEYIATLKKHIAELEDENKHLRPAAALAAEMMTGEWL